MFAPVLKLIVTPAGLRRLKWSPFGANRLRSITTLNKEMNKATTDLYCSFFGLSHHSMFMDLILSLLHALR